MRSAHLSHPPYDECLDDWDDQPIDPILASMHVEAVFVLADDAQDEPALGLPVNVDHDTLIDLLVEAMAWQGETSPGTRARLLADEAAAAAWEAVEAATALITLGAS